MSDLNKKHMSEWNAADLSRVLDRVLIGMVKYHLKCGRSSRNTAALNQIPLLIAEARKRGLQCFYLDLLDPPLCKACKQRPGIQNVGRDFYCGRPLCRAIARRAAKLRKNQWVKKSAEVDVIVRQSKVDGDTRALSKESRRLTWKGHG